MRTKWYDTAQICLDGHVITAFLQSSPQKAMNFCDRCGKPTISSCPDCDTIIRGFYHGTGVISFSEYEPPGYCHQCGKPYPWREAKIQAAHTLAEEMEDLSAEEREMLSRSIDDLVVDSPRTELAATRFKRLLVKVGEPAARALRELVVDIAGSAAAKLIKGQ